MIGYNVKLSTYFHSLSYDEFQTKRLYPKELCTFSKEEVEWALYETEYKYFGMYEFTDQQAMALDILEWAAKDYIK